MSLLSRVTESNYFMALQALTLSEEKDADYFISELLKDHFDDLVADLVTHPEQSEKYQTIAANLKKRNSLNTVQSIDYIERIAKCLEKNDVEGIQNLNSQMSHLIPDLKIVSKITPQGPIHEVQKITHPKIKAIILANFINQNHIAIKELNLSKQEILSLGPYLTYVDCRDCFDKSFNDEEINSFIECCSCRVKTLMIDNNIVKLPFSLPVCETLICKECHELIELSELPLCTTLDCSLCDNLHELPKLPACRNLNCSNTKLRQLPSLPACQILDCSFTSFKVLPGLPACQTLNCSNTHIWLLPPLPNCQNLDCSDSKLVRIFALPICQNLNCNNCPDLQSLPPLPQCENLHCQNCVNLKNLPSLNECKNLFCCGCSSLRFIHQLNKCEIIYCQECTNLIELPSLPLCEILYCSRSSLRELPPLPECKILDCSSCKNLKNLNALPKCETLNCSFNHRMIELPNLPSCQSLNCSYCINLMELSELKVCHVLDCSYCSMLTELPELLVCQDLNCSFNPKLRNFLSLPECTILNCDHSSNLTTLPILPMCKKVSCQNCSNLIFLGDLPECQNLFCNGCINLTRLPSLEVCETLICFGCVNLAELPLLEVCETLFCNGCTKLTKFPELLMCDNLTYGILEGLDINSVPIRFRPQSLEADENLETLQIRMKELSDNPLNVLLRLRDFVSERRFMPEIQFIEDDERASQGEDAGGVSRVFLSRLMPSLILNSEKNNQLKFIEMKSGLYMPVIDSTRNLRLQVKGFQILGSIFDLCLWSQGLDAELTTGIIFDQELFRQILNFTYEDLEQIDLDPKKIPKELKLKLIANSSNSHLNKIGKWLLKPIEELTLSEFEILRQTIVNDIDDEEKVPEDFFPRNFQKQDLKLKEMQEMAPWVCHYVTKMITKIFDPQILPICIFAKQLQSRIGTKIDFENLVTLGDYHLSQKIQGKISKEMVKEAIKYFGNRNLDEQKVNQTKAFVEKWIYDQTTMTKDLMNLCSFITGSPTLKSSTELTIYLYNRSLEQLPTARTCFNVLEMTIHYPDYETFKAKLKLALAYAANPKTAALEFR